MSFPDRFIGYGAYNLCFDSLLGKPNPATKSSLDYFDYIRSKDVPDVNLVKVILFRNSTVEDLPRARALPLYHLNQDKIVEINPAFLNNLVKLVKRAAETKFTVQVCIFHFQALELPDSEFPEIVPPIFDRKKLGSDVCKRCLNFFDVNNADRLSAQKQLVTTVANKLSGHPNVIWELCNEIRVQGCADPDTANCKIVPWLREMRDTLRSVISKAGITTSTAKSRDNTGSGVRNEEIIFGKTDRSCQNPPLDADYYDLHFGQWFEFPDLDGDGWSFPEGVLQAKYRCGLYGPPTLKHIIINDDGAHDNKKVEDVYRWAWEAFFRKLSFSSKQPYEPGRRFDDKMLKTLQDASNVNIGRIG